MIRTATIADVPMMRVLFAELLGDVRRRFPDIPLYPALGDAGLDQFTLCLVDIVQRGTWWLTLVVEEADGVVGFLVAEECRHPIGQPERFVYVHWFYVRPTHRGREGKPQSDARAMVRELLKWAVVRGIDQIECEAALGDDQWARRGLRAYRTKYEIGVAELVAWMSQQEAASAAAPAPPVMTTAKAEKTRRRVNGTAIAPRRRKRPEEHPDA